ncbi:MAG: nitrilase-related carbon-nitrogen hydrolase [Clostridia bacterium]
MKICIYQPPYPKRYDETTAVMESMASALKKCNDDVDLLVLPEYSNCPGMSDIGEMKEHCHRNNGPFLSSLCRLSAERRIAVAVNMLFEKNGSFYNTTFLIDKNGEIIAEYDKTHLAHAEIHSMGLVPGDAVSIVGFLGCRISFAVCFEMYFPEYLEAVAAGFPDIILSPSYQRSEDSEILKKQVMGRALDMDAFIVRSSYSLGEDSSTGGESMVVSPKGEILLGAGQKTGLFYVEIDPGEKRIRPVAHGLEKLPARRIVEDYRIPSLYRHNMPSEKSASSFPWPRVCAHRGLSGRLPENTLPSFSAAVALGVDEIEFDVRLTRDGKMIVCHDQDVDRVSDGSGQVSQMIFADIRKLNAGFYMGWDNVRFPTPEEVFSLVGGQVVMNIHIYESGKDGFVISELKRLADKYRLRDYIYFAGQEDVMRYCLAIAPEIERCMLECFLDDTDIVDIALQYKCTRVQHFFSVYSPGIVSKASAAGLLNNLFFEDDPANAKARLCDGIDSILTNYADRMLPAVRRFQTVCPRH